MSEISSSAQGGGMAPERLKSYVDERLRPHKAGAEIATEPKAHGLAPETAMGPLHEAMAFLWLREDGDGPFYGRVGTWHMMIGALLFAAGVGAAMTSYHFAIDLWAPVAAVLFGAIFAGGVEFAYGIIRLMDG